MRRRGYVCGFLTMVAMAVPVLAQTGGLRVEVRDGTTGDPVPGATVMLSSAGALIPPTAELTDERGLAEFPILRAGPGYVIEVSFPGLAAQRRADLHVRVSEVLRVEVLLGAATEETVEARAERAVVDLEQVGSTTRFTDEFIEDLPQRGRQYQDVLTKTPGVLDEDGDGNPNVHGARTRDFRAEVSGISNVDPLTGQWLAYVNLDSIEALEVIPLGAGVEFGRAQGGFARVLQKQGTNEFEGVLGFLYRSSKLDGDGAGNTGDQPTPEFDTFQPSLQLAGPIVKDKLWYRLSHEYIQREDPVNTLGSIGVTTLEQTIAADQLTWQASPRNRLTFQYQHDPLRIENLDIDSRVTPEASATFDREGSTYSIGWTAPLSSRVLVDSTVAWQDHNHDLFPSQPDAEQDCVVFFGIPRLNNIRCQNVTENRLSGPYPETSLDERQRLTVRSQATLYSNAGSQSHRLKVGFVAESERYARTYSLSPSIDIEVIEPPFGNIFALATMQLWNPQDSTARVTGNSWAIYGEDQWKPAPNLGITFGLRLDHEEIDAPGRHIDDPIAEARSFFEMLDAGVPVQQVTRSVFTGFEDPLGYLEQMALALDIPAESILISPEMTQSAFWFKRRRPEDLHLTNDNLAPRLSLAWDPWSNGKTKISVSAGRYYDKIFLAVPLVEVEPLETRNSFTASSTMVNGFRQFFSNPHTVSLRPLSIRQIDSNLSTPYQDEWSVAFEREIFAETAIRASYVRRRFRDQLQDVDVNHAPGDFGRCVLSAVALPLGGFQLQTTLGPSPGTGLILDPLTMERYMDTDPGNGDGVIDDCTGDRNVLGRGGQFEATYDLPDGRPDPYVLNPGWEEILLVGNFNRADYEAFVLEWVRRLHRNWQLQASYTWSEANGDAEDFNLLLGNEPGLREDESGLLDYDQTHVVKVDATGWIKGFRLGGSVSWQSGLPYSVLMPQTSGFSSPPIYPFQRTTALRSRLRYPSQQRNDQRNDSWLNLDLRVARDFRLDRQRLLQASVEVFNVLNDDTLSVSGITRLEDARSGVLTESIAGSRRFGRRWQLGLRFTF